MLQTKLTNIITDFIRDEIFCDTTLELSPTVNLSDYGIQSIEIMELIALIERRFDCKLPTEFVYQKNIKSIKSIVHFLSSFLNQKIEC